MTSNDWDLTAATNHAQLGLPLGTGVRLRALKRIIARACWPFFSHQIEFNQRVLAALESMQSASAQSQFEAETWPAARDRIDRLDAELSSLRHGLEHISAVTERQDHSLERHEELAVRSDKRFDRITDETELVSLKVDLAQRQIVSRVQEAISEFRDELNRMSDEIASTRKSLDEAAGQ